MNLTVEVDAAYRSDHDVQRCRKAGTHVTTVDRLDADHGCLKYGWLDANIHAMLIWCLAPLLGFGVYEDSSFGYRHNKHVSHLGSPAIQWDESLPFYPS